MIKDCGIIHTCHTWEVVLKPQEQCGDIISPLGVSSPVPSPSGVPLSQVNDTFVLNCLGEGEYSALMKHFLKRFPAGANRFEGVEVFTAANCEPLGGFRTNYLGF